MTTYRSRLSLSDRLVLLKQRYAKARKNHRPRIDIEHEMVMLVLKQMKREIRQDRKAARHAHC